MGSSEESTQERHPNSFYDWMIQVKKYHPSVKNVVEKMSNNLIRPTIVAHLLRDISVILK